jgi:hypothetical protein
VLALIFIFAAITTAPIKYMGDSDMFALGFALLSLSFLIKHFNNESNKIFIILFFITVALLPQIRYAYVPISLSLILLYFITSFFNNKCFNKWQLGLLVFPALSFLKTFTNPYFLGTADRYTNTSTETIQVVTEKAIIWLKPFYAPFFNSFYPDYILVSFGLKQPELWAKIAVYIFAGFAIASLGILIVVLLNYFGKKPSIKNLFKGDKISETGLLFIAFSTLAFFILIQYQYAYKFSEINSETILYKSLGVVNRYYAPIHGFIFPVSNNIWYKKQFKNF